VKINHAYGVGKMKRFVRDYLQNWGIRNRIIHGERAEGGDVSQS